MVTQYSIDPGLSGAIARFEDGEAVEVIDMPTLKEGTGNKREIDANGIVDYLEPGAEVVIEKQQAMPKQGVASTFKTGVGYGKLIGLLDALAFRYRIVTPAAWSKKVKRPAKSGKDWCISRARQEFPHLKDILLKSKDGRADSLLIGLAEFGLNRVEASEDEDKKIDLPDW